MMQDYWQRQTEEPLFPDILWSRPQNKKLAKRLLVIGGHSHAFQNVASSYQMALDDGIGEAKVALPGSLKIVIGNAIEDVVYLPRTPSGGIARKALDDIHEFTAWADGVFLPGDTGRDSETTVMLDHFAMEESVPLTLTRDGFDAFAGRYENLFKRPQTLLVVSLSQLQKALVDLKFPKPIKSGMGIVQLIEILHELTKKYPANLIVRHDTTLVVASGGEVSTTKTDDEKIWRLPVATRAAVFWLQNLESPFEALTTSVFKE